MKLAIDETRCKGCNPGTEGLPVPDFSGKGHAPTCGGLWCRNSTARNAVPTAGSAISTAGSLPASASSTCPDQALHWVEEEPYEPHKVAIEY